MRKLILFLELILLISSCKKQPSGQSPKYNPEHGRLIASHYIRDQFVSGTYTYTYDVSARLSTSKLVGSATTNYYRYATNQVTVSSDRVEGTYILSGGNAINFTFPNWEYRKYELETYQYTSDGYLAAELDTLPDQYYGYGIELSYQYLNNNCQSYYKYMSYNYSNPSYAVNSYFRYTNILNTIGNHNNGIYYLGKDNQNLPSVRLDVENGDTVARTYYTYELNSDSTVHVCYTAYTQLGSTQHDTDIYTYY
jgi:hypothetical protein